MIGTITCMGQRKRVIRFQYKAQSRVFRLEEPLSKLIAARLKAGTAVAAWETDGYYTGEVGQQRAIWFVRSGDNLKRLEDGK